VSAFRTAAEKAIRFVAGLLPHLTVPAWLSFALPLTVMLAFVIGVGPEAQRAIFSTISSDAPTIYEAVYGNEIQPFPKLLTWLGTSFWWPFLLIATTVVVASLRAASVRLALLSVAVWTAALLTVNDLIFSMATDTFSISAHLVNLTANLAGSIAVALIFAIALIAYRAIREAFTEHRLLSLAFAGSAIVIAGIATSTATYYGLRFVYDPLPAPITAVLSPPSSGYFLGHQPPDRAALNLSGYPEENFDFIGEVEDSSRVSVEALGPLSATWRSDDALRGYNLSVRFLLDCMFQQADELPQGRPAISLPRITAFDLTTNEGNGRIDVSTGETPSVRYFARTLASFTMSREAGGPQNVTIFSPPGSELRIEDDAHTFLVSANLFRSTEEQTVAAARTFTIRTGGDTVSLTFRPTAPAADDTPVRCHTLDQVTGPEIDVGSAMNVVALVTIAPNVQTGTVRSYAREVLTLGVGQGWTTVSALEAHGTGRRSNPRFLSFLAGGGGLTDVRLNGESADIRPYETIMILGSFSAQSLDDGRVYVSGVARAGWRGDTRINTTRWEKASDWGLWLVGGVLGMLVGLATWLWPRMLRISNEDFRRWSE
jgi:hypothetical protein